MPANHPTEGGLFPAQAVLYAKVVSAFQETGLALRSASQFWALMWFVLALVVGVGYFGIGAVSRGLGKAVSEDYRRMYFAAFVRLPIAYFDAADNAPAQLVARLDTEPDAVNSLAGDNVGVVVTVLVSLVGTVVLGLVIGWQFTLVVLAGALPFIFAASYVRERMEHTFEDNAGKVFDRCVGFAAESVAAIRTVVSLNMETYV